MTRHKGIIAYGTEADREKVAALAKLAGLSVSEYIINMIRGNYSMVAGSEDPRKILKT